MILLNQLDICIGLYYTHMAHSVFSQFSCYIYIHFLSFNHFVLLPETEIKKMCYMFFNFDRSYCQLLKIYHMKWNRNTKYILFDNCLI